VTSEVADFELFHGAIVEKKLLFCCKNFKLSQQCNGLNNCATELQFVAQQAPLTFPKLKLLPIQILCILIFNICQLLVFFNAKIILSLK
jgi:hypothetical protein